MTESIPVHLLGKWVNELQSILKGAAQEAKTDTDYLINKGMRHGLDQVQHRIRTWLRHRENRETLNRSGNKFLITKDVNLTDGRYRKLEWYERGLFITLAWRHAMNAETGELMLKLEHVHDLSKKYLVYVGDLTFDDLAGLARGGGLQSVKNEESRGEWVEKIWT